MGLDSGHVQGGIQKLGLVSEIQELNFASLGLDLGEVRASMPRVPGFIWELAQILKIFPGRFREFWA